MKKFLALLLVLVMALSFAACGDNSESNGKADGDTDQTTVNNDDNPADELTVENLMNREPNPASDFELDQYYDEETKEVRGVEIRNYIGESDIVVIPEEIDGEKVVAISKYAFSNDCPVKAVKLPNNMEFLDIGCFGLNDDLQILICGSGLKYIADGAFQNCTNLRELVLNGDGLTIGAIAFGGCERLKSVEIPDSVVKIDPTAFWPCTDDFTIIGAEGSYAQYFVENELYDYISYNFESNGKTFSGEVPTTVPETSVVLSDEISLENLMSYPEIKEELIFCVENDEGYNTIVGQDSYGPIIVIPDTYKGKEITRLGAWLIEDVMKAVRLGDNIIDVKNGVFAGHDLLEIVAFGDNVKSISHHAFMNCTALRQVVLNDGLEIIDRNAFEACTALKEIEIPDTVKTIDDKAFFKCSEDLVIIGSAGSEAERFAKSAGFSFQTK